MEENLNIFGKNQGEIGFLDKNLVLRTKGRVYIRYGKKYIELLDDKGNINVKIPKVLTKVDSEEEIKNSGFYLLDENLYAYYDGELIQITGVEGQFISYAIKQNLSQEQIDIAQKNIGLKFKTINDATKIISEGIVFVGSDIYYVNGNSYTKLTLNSPLKEINNAGLEDFPSEDNSCIAYIDGEWIYAPLLTKRDLNNLKLEILEELNEEELDEEEEEFDSIFDPIQYSKVYTIRSGNSSDSGIIDLKTSPAFDQKEGDIAIFSVNVIKAKSISTQTNSSGNQVTAVVADCEIKKGEIIIDDEGNIVTYSDGSPKYEETIVYNEDIKTFNLKVQDNETLLYINEEGNTYTLEVKEGYMFYNESEFEDGADSIADGKKVDYATIEGTTWIFNNGFTKSLKNKHLYIKAEQSKKEKFKIDYAHAEIALEENYPTNSEGETPEEKAKPKIIPHTVLGDLDDKSEYYNSPAKSFRTYKEKENSQGLFSDQAVFVGTEFRQPLDYEEPEASEDSEVEVEYADTDIYNFPRYSKTLNEILCTKHKLEDFEEDDPFNDVVPSIRYLKGFIEDLQKKIDEMNTSIDNATISINGAIPVGTIVMWGKSILPEGWNLCDGGTYDGITTPDLRDKFIVGAGNTYSMGDTGGNKEITLTISQLPSHAHEFYDYLTQVHGNDEINTGTATINGESMTIGKHSTTKNPTRRAQTDNSGHSDMPYLKHNTSSTGGDNPIDITPPYYALSYIMKTKEIQQESSEDSSEEDTNE